MIDGRRQANLSSGISSKVLKLKTNGLKPTFNSPRGQKKILPGNKKVKYQRNKS